MLARGISQEGTQTAQIPLHTPQHNRLLLPSASKQHTMEDLGQQQELAARIKPCTVNKFGAGGKHRFCFVRGKCFSYLTQHISSPTLIFTVWWIIISSVPGMLLLPDSRSLLHFKKHRHIPCSGTHSSRCERSVRLQFKSHIRNTNAILILPADKVC